MDYIEKQILDEALKQYKKRLFVELHGYNEDDLKRYGHETKELMAKIDNIRKRTWEGCL